MSWTLRPGARLLWRSWDDDEYLVFDDASGDTHLVNGVTACILELLEQANLEPADAAGRVAGSLGVDPDALAPHLGPLLDHLERIGLVERTS